MNLPHVAKTVIIERIHPLTGQRAPIKITAEDISATNIKRIVEHVRQIEGAQK